VLTVDALLAALGLAAALDAVYRGARRRSELDAPRLAEADPRASILYLRNFADDRVRIRTSPLTRRSLPEKVGIRQTEPFEELIVRYLSSYGPVRAVSDPRDPKGPLGVAREPLPMANWREPVEELIRKSRLIVVGATPAGSADGLRWELETIAGCGALDRTILLFAPRPAEEMEGHWRRFRAMAAFRAPEGIDAFTDRTLAVRADSAGNWRAVHADRRSDWAYALAMSHLAEEILQAAPGSPAPTTHQAGHD
jgi:hypothetical protein